MGFKFYDPLYKYFFVMKNVKFVEDYGSTKLRDVVFEKEIIDFPTIITTIVTNNEKNTVFDAIRIENIENVVN